MKDGYDKNYQAINAGNPCTHNRPSRMLPKSAYHVKDKVVHFLHNEKYKKGVFCTSSKELFDYLGLTLTTSTYCTRFYHSLRELIWENTNWEIVKGCGIIVKRVTLPTPAVKSEERREGMCYYIYGIYSTGGIYQMASNETFTSRKGAEDYIMEKKGPGYWGCNTFIVLPFRITVLSYEKVMVNKLVERSLRD